MSKKVNKPRQREIGRTKIEKKHLIDPRYKNLFWTIVFLVVMIIFFIVNNTREVPEHGPYPPGYNQNEQKKEFNKDIPSELQINK